MNEPTIILAIDGGGIKGLIPAIFLRSIEEAIGKKCFQAFDLIGGNSTGGIIAAGLTSRNHKTGNPYTATEIVAIYESKGDHIFEPQASKFLWGKIYAKYHSENKRGKGIEPYMQYLLGATTKLSDSYSYIQALENARVKQMFTTSYMVNGKGGKTNKPHKNKDFGPYLFNWHDANTHPSHKDYYIWEAARGSSAAPVYFPIAHVGGNSGPRSAADEKWVVDGGVMSNDPAVWGISEALRTGLAKRLEDIIVISLGTGIYQGNAGVGITNERCLIPRDGNWGELTWAGLPRSLYNLDKAKTASLLYIMMDAVQMVTDSQLKAFVHGGLTYLRLEPSLTLAQSAMDNISPANIASLIKTATDYLAIDGKTKFEKIIAVLKNA